MMDPDVSQAIAESYRAQIYAMAEVNGTRQECKLWQQLAGGMAAENRALKAEIESLYATQTADRLYIREMEAEIAKLKSEAA